MCTTAAGAALELRTHALTQFPQPRAPPAACYSTRELLQVAPPSICSPLSSVKPNIVPQVCPPNSVPATPVTGQPPK